MILGRKTEFMLYALGKFYSLYDKRFNDKLLKVSVSKKAFINLLKDASITKLSERMIYRHLEILEKKKLIKYDLKRLDITERGRKQFLKTKRYFESYFNLGIIFEKKDLSKIIAKSQSFFSEKN